MKDQMWWILILSGIILCGVTLGVAGYTGVYLLGVKGIIELIRGCVAHPINASMIAWGIVKALLAGPVTIIISSIGVPLGGALVKLSADD